MGMKFYEATASQLAAATPATQTVITTTDTSPRKVYIGDGSTLGGVLVGPVTRDVIEAKAPSAVTISTSTTLTKAAHQGKVLYCTTNALNITVNTSSDFDAYASCEIVFVHLVYVCVCMCVHVCVCVCVCV